MCEPPPLAGNVLRPNSARMDTLAAGAGSPLRKLWLNTSSFFVRCPGTGSDFLESPASTEDSSTFNIGHNCNLNGQQQQQQDELINRTVEQQQASRCYDCCCCCCCGLRGRRGQQIVTYKSQTNVQERNNNNIRIKQQQQQQHHKRKTTPTRLAEPGFLTNILLPLLLIILLPTLKLDLKQTQSCNSISQNEQQPQLQLQPDCWLAQRFDQSSLATNLIWSLVRLPLDRLHLEARILSASAGAAPSGSQTNKRETTIALIRNDLQEEETQLMAAEHRGAPAYMSTSSGGGGGLGSHAYLAAEPGAGQGEVHAVEYGPPASMQDEQAGGGGAGLGPPDGPQPTGDSGGGGGRPLIHQSSASSLQARNDLPAVKALNVKCEKNYMTVNIVFDKPFYGMVFSKGHYNDQKCVHLLPNSGQKSVNFEIYLNKCGMTSSDATGALGGGGGGGTGITSVQSQQQQQQQPNGLYIENTIIIQYDPLVQEIYDQARKLRCTWYDYYEKSVSFRPYNVDMLDAVTANFLGDNIQCWMQIQVGKGPWASEVSGIVKIGQTMTMVLAIKDDENRFDMLVRNCVAHDGKHQPIQLVDEFGCVARPKIMSKFQKVRNFGTSATVVSYAHFQAFKFPDSMSVHFQCIIQVCRYECPEPSCPQLGSADIGGPAAPSSSSSQLLGGPGAQHTAGGSSGAPPASGAGDYTAAGTEMVASKEPMPQQPQQQPGVGVMMAGGGQAAFAQHQPTAGGYFVPNLAAASPANLNSTNNVHLKLDESQGRIQVKLDTSMMAGGLNGNRQQHAQQPAGGPLPPHLLHMASGSAEAPTSQANGRPYNGNNNNNNHHQHLMSVQSSYHGPGQARPAPASGRAQQQQQQPLLVAPPGASQVHHYSPPYNTPAAASQRRSMTTMMSAASPGGGPFLLHRLGDSPLPQTAFDEPDQLEAAGSTAWGGGAPYEQAGGGGEHPLLSLIGSPRGLKLGSPTQSAVPSAGGGHQLRLRRHVGGDSGANQANQSNQSAARQARHSHLGGQESTAVQTHRSIQVVSPDDVAFSLLDDHTDADAGTQSDGLFGAHETVVAGDKLSTRRRKQSRRPTAGYSQTVTQVDQQQQQQQVCFTAARFLWGLLVGVGALASSIALVTFVILRQRSQLEQKLSTVYDPTIVQQQAGYCGASSSSTLASGQQQQPHRHLASGQLLGATQAAQAAAAAAAEARRRQRDELQHRNNYLGRLYSQFAPASYWRQ